MSSKRLAGLVGPALARELTISETVNLDIWKTNFPGLTYLKGTLLFVGGRAIVHAHKVWVRAWPVLLALVGWLAMATSFVPDVERHRWEVRTRRPTP
jgi:hypothetical protein